MALYIGSKQYDIHVGNQGFTQQFFSTVISTLSGTKLLTSDGIDLLDANGYILTVED